MSARRRWRRARLALLPAVVAGVAGWTAARLAAEPHWLDVAGPEWAALGDGERRAWVAGFLAGTAGQQAGDAGATDSLRLRVSVDSLRRGGKLAFPFAPPVLLARLGDYYHYENHAPLPVWFALCEINGILGRHGAHDR